MKTAFGDSLLMPGDMLGDTLPSLDQLKGKVLVKGKRCKAPANAAAVDVTTGEDDDDDEGDDDDDIAEGELKEADSAVVQAQKTMAKKYKEKTHPDLSAITYLGTCHVKNFSPEESAKIPPDMMTSYAEGKTLKYLKKEEIVRGWIEHNKIHLRLAIP